MSSTAQGRFAHLPELEGVRVECIFEFLLFLDNFLQVTHRHTFSDVDGERVVRYIENPTENFEHIRRPSGSNCG